MLAMLSHPKPPHKDLGQAHHAESTSALTVRNDVHAKVLMTGAIADCLDLVSSNDNVTVLRPARELVADLFGQAISTRRENRAHCDTCAAASSRSDCNIASTT